MKVSVLTSVYNKGQWLERWFQSVRNQSFKDIEIVVVDNASTDNSAEIIRKNADEDSRIKVITLKPNRGPAGGLQVALDNLSGSYFTILDADDFIDINYIEVLYNAIEKYDADISMCLNDIVFSNGKNIHKNWPSKGMYVIEGEKVNLLPCQLLDELSNKYFGFYMPEMGASWDKMMKSSIVKDHSIEFNSDLWIWCDFDFWLKCILNVKKLVYTTDAIYHFYQSEDSVTREKKYNPYLLSRIRNAMESIYLQVVNHKSSQLLLASTRFLFNRYKEFILYLWSHRNEMETKVFSKTYKDFLNTSSVKFLLNYDDKYLLNHEELRFLAQTGTGHIRRNFMINRIKTDVRSSLGKLYHLLVHRK